MGGKFIVGIHPLTGKNYISTGHNIVMKCMIGAGFSTEIYE
jgi:hypothetical protein